MAGTVTVFGGTGFLGRRVVLRLRDKRFSVRVASRHPERGQGYFGGAAGQEPAFEVTPQSNGPRG